MSPKSVATVPSLVAASASHIRRLSSSSAENSKQVTVVDDDDSKLVTPTNKWAPFESKADFNLDVTLMLVFIVCFVLGVFLLNYIINRFTSTRGNHDDDDDQNGASKEIKNREINTASGPTLEFSKGVKMASTEAVCAICLSEFVEGEGIRVLPKCNHGFHINCIEKWLLNFKTSCPTCRTNCLNSSLPTKTDSFDDVANEYGDVESGGAATELAVIRAVDYHQEEEGGSGGTTTSTGSGSSSPSSSSSSSVHGSPTFKTPSFQRIKPGLSSVPSVPSVC